MEQPPPKRKVASSGLWPGAPPAHPHHPHHGHHRASAAAGASPPTTPWSSPDRRVRIPTEGTCTGRNGLRPPGPAPTEGLATPSATHPLGRARSPPPGRTFPRCLLGIVRRLVSRPVAGLTCGRRPGRGRVTRRSCYRPGDAHVSGIGHAAIHPALQVRLVISGKHSSHLRVKCVGRHRNALRYRDTSHRQDSSCAARLPAGEGEEPGSPRCAPSPASTTRRSSCGIWPRLATTTSTAARCRGFPPVGSHRHRQRRRCRRAGSDFVNVAPRANGPDVGAQRAATLRGGPGPDHIHPAARALTTSPGAEQDTSSRPAADPR